MCIGCLLATILLILFVPRNKIREAHVIFLFVQVITWLVGLIVVEYRLIEYPDRFFEYSTKTSFAFEYFIYPSICIIFNLYYPEKKNIFRQFMHNAYYCTGITITEVLCERYTNIIKYIHWSWYITWITLFITFYASRIYYVWFFRLKNN
ncbi:CBO0543 family protein [Clostridium polyendosporum]|nr:CBO0543 family protein [Clostridium polyendosporum]